jgi:hypothetical protein
VEVGFDKPLVKILVGLLVVLFKVLLNAPSKRIFLGFYTVKAVVAHRNKLISLYSYKLDRFLLLFDIGAKKFRIFLKFASNVVVIRKCLFF